VSTAPIRDAGTALRAVARTPGGPDALVLEQVPTPVPGPGQVRIAVQGAGVAFGDVQLRQGRLPGRFPVTPGYDVVGHVDAAGPGVEQPAVGQRVAAYVGVGGYTTSALARAELCVPVGEDLDTAQVSALTLNYTTAAQLLRAARVPAGGRVLVLGAAGGVGSALTELALLDGLTVTVTGTASAARLPALMEKGITALADADDPPDPVDTTFDPVGGPSIARSRRRTRRGGTVVVYGMTGSNTRDLSRAHGMAAAVWALARARVTPGPRVVGFFGGPAKQPAVFAADLQRLLGLLADHRLDPQVTTMPLTAVADAHRRLEERRVLGKVVLLT